jgi:hypothetical protein
VQVTARPANHVTTSSGATARNSLTIDSYRSSSA